ncbi:ABC transporter ATP-binding protein [Tenacibaculum sp. 1_MG-2023]|uniref:ABC transporter ATP-binding protein n=1 Tax=Tenacibaculum sp. 1_MG-2023 TaxID=3062653 RepID=UPI0026E2D0B8|nr:ABC transporter ATP-binding protein [Tenacibaculum sp. 1_MG-2023]MDO6600690.1 ABC transporter ATP-binding protein [Tenacibaculum sp. 1_MG-2023]
MKDVILKVENLSKQYRLGTVGTGTISHDLNRWWANIRGKEDPYLRVGDANDRSSKASSEYVWALKDINFDVKRGEVLGIIGKNGAGKSTLLKILSKVTGPTTGSIKSKGRIASLLEVGTGFHPEMTGRENIFLNGAILGMTKKEIASKLDEIIDFSGCERYVDTPVKRYSSGMKVRLAFAVAAHLEPDILVVDEVLAVGDAEFQKKAIGKMQDISKGDGRTVLFVSHDMMAIQNLCTRLITLDDGKVSFEGNVESGIIKYLNKESSIKKYENLLDLKFRRGDKSAKFKSIKLSSLYKGVLYNDINKVYSGSEKVFIDIEISNFKESREVFISLDISDAMNNPVSNVSNEFTQQKIILKEGNNKIQFEIDNFNFRAMDYCLSLWGADAKNNVFDFLKNEIIFSVIETDFYNTNKMPRGKQHGYFLLNNKVYEK